MNERLKTWIEAEQKKTQAEIDALPFDPTLESLRRYKELSDCLLWLGQLKARHFPPPKPEPDPELEELIY